MAARSRPAGRRPEVLGARYNSAEQRLEVLYEGGLAWCWEGVSPETWALFRSDEEEGRFNHPYLGLGAAGGWEDV